MINLSDPVTQLFVLSLIVTFLPLVIMLFLIHKTSKKDGQPPKLILAIKNLPLVRLLQVVLICAIIWFVAWAHVYEVLVWHKPFTQTFYTSFGNVLAYILLSIILVYTEYNLHRYKRLRRRDQNKIPNPVSQATSKTLLENLQELEDEKEEFRRELWKLKRLPKGTIGYVLFAFGIIALSTSVLLESVILAFIGLGLTFWGASLTFIKPQKYIKTDISDSTSISSLTAIDKIISDLNYKGKAIYLPPRHLKEIKNEKAFIPSRKNASVPPAEEVAETKVFLKNPQGMLIVPPGLALANLYERELKTDFIKVDLPYLQNNLPKLLIENLEIAENFEINSKSSIIHAKITGSKYQEFCKEASTLPNICGSIGCPICSSIAIALTRATGKPVVIERNDLSKDGKTIEIHYKLLEA